MPFGIPLTITSAVELEVVIKKTYMHRCFLFNQLARFWPNYQVFYFLHSNGSYIVWWFFLWKISKTLWEFRDFILWYSCFAIDQQDKTSKWHHITVENGEVIVEMVRSRHGLLNFPILNLKYYCYLTLTPYFFIFFEIYEARVLLRWWDCFSELPTLLYLFVWPSVTPIFQDLHRFRGQ